MYNYDPRKAAGHTSWCFVLSILVLAINACVDSTVCDQFCNRVTGQDICSCRSGFLLASDGATCTGK